MKIRTFPLTAAVMGSLLLCACSGDDGATGDKGDNGLSSLVNVTVLNVGDANCPAGGQRIETGLDANRNGVLDESEVDPTQIQFVCQPQVVGLTAELIGRHQTGIYGLSAAEIVEYHSASNRIFVVNAISGKVDIIDGSLLATSSAATEPLALNNLDKLAELDVAKDVGQTFMGSVNSVSISGNLLAAAIERGDAAGNKTQTNGFVAFYQLNGADTPQFISAVEVGALPDNVVFTHDGKMVVVANEGEPNSSYTLDPEGSIALIAITEGKPAATATIIGFSDFNQGGTRHSEITADIKINGPMASVAQDLEPEYIAVSQDNRRAFVSLQENNAIAVIDIVNAKVAKILPLGLKDYGLEVNKIDASDKDDRVNLQSYTGVYGMYQPDTLATYRWNNTDFIVTANEGDSRDYSAFSEEARAGDLILDANHPQFAAAKDKTQLARLKVTTSMGDDDKDGDYDRIVSFGARSFSIWTADGQQVFDSGSDFERITAALLGNKFNNNNEENKGDSRSDDKGPEPEALALGQIGQRLYAFIGLERTSGFMIYDVTNPFDVHFIDYVVNRDFDADFTINTETGVVKGDATLAGDLGPEGMKFVSADKSPNSKPLLIIGNEVSGSTSVYQLNVK
ncbi:choice-of-anchor I family protein [Shewanella sp. JNE10-2]|uniref:choice-of-anchor I family protein n=1 Tax=unclassified Shewanella TaxID=196818 RepID=UPI002002F29D|nr:MULTISPECIES: choice-of-anchor I family protein [unclassified Shewanella]MCK7629217.1 choice-of-anchor I family protein [Shewanella sp. JNE9-1]MCK7644287.1 choice-of-anchor I family protein [Shewanella sp. JNE3-1]MCK7652637.1 choice-of-anchor I family protein [Shewanella sp. JNE4-1]UPO26440.1 choice-of-anchor I family protein [Shewanella sp. JNE10-2]UPO33637.1 choice-of-anchor I family protein [Shewanella sp. JNE7]